MALVDYSESPRYEYFHDICDRYCQTCKREREREREQENIMTVHYGSTLSTQN